MKKLLSAFLAVILVLTIMSPITVFAENGPYPNDFENVDFENIEDILNLKMSAVMFIDYNIVLGALGGGLEDSDIRLEDAIGLVYPADETMPLPEIFSGASYDLETNTLTLNNVKSKNAILGVLAMGDDFKIKLEGYNEFAAIMSMGMEWGGSITLIGDGELVLGRSEEAFISGLTIQADSSASFFHVEDTVKLKVYSNPDFMFDSVSIVGSTVTDPAELIKLGGNVVSDAPVFKNYTIEFYEQAEAYDLEWNCFDWYQLGLKKDDTYYIADEQYDLETFEPSGKYLVYALSYDELLDCYTLSEYADGEPITLEGFTVYTEFEPLYDQSLGYYIGYTDYAGEEEGDYKTVFYPVEKEPFDLCVDENGKKYGFSQYPYEDIDTGVSGVDTYVYNLIEHPTYGLIAIEDTSRTTLDGLTPLKIGEKDYADCYISSNLVINNGGAVIEPAKIKNVKASATSKGAKISWSADPAAEGYKIFRKASGDKKWTVIDTVGADETSVYDKNVKSGKKYTYKVSGFNFVGEGQTSSNVTLTYYAAPKVSIKNTTKGIYLSWSKISGATKYKIYRQTSGSSKWTLLDTETGTSFTDKTAKSGKKYYYRVRAAKGDVMGGYNEVSKYFLSAPKLSSVKNASSGVEVKWSKVTGAEGYKVYRKSGSGSYKYIGKTSKTTYTDTTAKSGTTYTYTAKAYKSKTDSSYNSTGLKLKYLAAPKAKTTVYTSSISVSWSKVSGAKEYAVYRKASGESNYKKVTTTTKTSYKDTNVKNNKTYSYRVRAINGKTTSAYKTIKQLFLSVPKLSSVKNTNTGVEFKWAKVSGAEKYRVYRKTGSGDFKLLATTKKTSYLDDTAKSGTVYTYTVKACKDDATGYYNKTGLKIRYVRSTGLYSADNVANGVQLRWTPADKADKYYVYRKLDGESSFKQIDVISADEVKKDQYGVCLYVDKTAKNGQVYFYNIKVSYKGTLSGFSSTVGRPTTRMTPIDVTSATATSSGIKIKWEKSAYATAYRILRREKGSDSEYAYYLYVDNGKTTTAVDQNVESGKTYEYAVLAIHDEFDGKWGSSAIGGSKSAKAK